MSSFELLRLVVVAAVTVGLILMLASTEKVNWRTGVIAMSAIIVFLVANGEVK